MTHVLDPKPEMERAAEAIRGADAFIFTAGAGMSVDSGLPDFRGPEGFWRCYPPMQKLGLTFADCSNPAAFRRDPRFAWGFFGHRYSLYTTAVPHGGYDVLRKWGEAASDGYFVFTSNVDGAFLRTGFPESRVCERHGSVHFLQPLHPEGREIIWPAALQMARLQVDPETLLSAEEGMPTCPETGGMARPNILMFSDNDFVSFRSDEQDDRMHAFVESLNEETKVVIIEIGAGTAVPTVRMESERLKRKFRNSTLIRINPDGASGSSGTISIRGRAKSVLEALAGAAASGPPHGLGATGSRL